MLIGLFVIVQASLRHGERWLKTQGSNKLDRYCQSRIQVTQYEDDKCSVIYQSTHVGHENEVRHLCLSQEAERESIAIKIASNILLKSDEIRDYRRFFIYKKRLV
ncbi:hypothetical protein JTE90_009829 [Oedothorax gibbosus]|uniref:Uncharacterized protein n=1 Tax=Oedothorax gibbosus TaxID=931172 RepID=A0AAV6UBV6_9ARAC|nr:hypothetical protein JTE90_009829 [Oedothorax gibbosus]